MEGTPFGRYRLVDLLGQGGMGEVWRAYDTVTDRVVAVKVLPAQLAHDQKFQQRFRREAKAAAGLNNPHVVPIHDFGEIDGRLYVDMRLIEGMDLDSLLLRSGPLPPERALRIVDQIASALQAAHRIGLVHRDVKPSNILVAEDDFAYLIDFGIARAAGEVGLTETGGAVGTWAYMAPERFQTGEGDARADVYALTCVLYQVLTARLPFPGVTLEQIATAHMLAPPPKPSMVVPRIPSAMDQVITMGMAKVPDQRYATTKDLANAAHAAIRQPSQQRTDPINSMMPTTPIGAVDNDATVHAQPVHPPRPQQPAAPPHQPTEVAPTQYRTPPASPNQPGVGKPAPVWRPVAAPPGSAEPEPAAPAGKSGGGRNRKFLVAAAVVAVVVAVAVTAVLFVGGSDEPTASGPASTSSASAPSPSSSSTSAEAAVPSGAMFSAEQPWTTDVSGSPKSENSDAIIAALSGMGGWGTDNDLQIDFSIPVYEADASTPRKQVVGTDDYCGGAPDCDPLPQQMPVPDGASLAGSSNLSCDTSGNTEGQNDCQLLVVDREGRKLYETYQATASGTDIMAADFFVWDLDKAYPENLRGDQCTSADAAGFPIAAMTPTADQVASGSIDFAMRFILPNDRIKAAVYAHPASHAGGPSSADPNAPPFGVRFRLKPDFDDSGYTDSQKVIITALKTHGMLLSDGGQVPLTFADDRTSTAKWSELGITADTFKGITPDAFEVVELGKEIPVTNNCVRNP